MADKKKREQAWAEAKRKCRLTAETVRMAKVLGMSPRTLIKNIPNKNQSWKAPVHEWIRDLYEERFERAAPKNTDKPTQQDVIPNDPHNPATDEHPFDEWSACPLGELPDLWDDAMIYTDEEAFLQDADESFAFFEPSRRGPSRKDIDEQNQLMLKRQEHFRTAAEHVAKKMADFEEVTKIILFGSVATPLKKEIPRFSEYRRAKVALWHECNDVDLAVWVSDLTNLQRLQKARSQAVTQLSAERNVHVAHHQIDVFLMEPGTDRYLGRLCCYSQCPKDKLDCLTPECGAHKFLAQQKDFILKDDALSSDRIVLLHEARHPNESDH